MILFLDALAGFFLVVMGLVGLRRGLVEELGRLLGLVVAALVAFRYYLELGQWLMGWIKLGGPLTLVLSYSAVFAVTLLITRLVTRLVQLLFLPRGVKWANRVMGVVFGFSKGILVLVIVVWLVDLFPDRGWARVVRRESSLVPPLTGIRNSVIQFFNMSDPVQQGEEFIKQFIEDIEIEDRG